ncbi:MAG: hypothetical protein HXS52_07975 [Theionarchaea archaeon]|nr:hypothetical protein [Theionarchaea archaeon]
MTWVPLLLSSPSPSLRYLVLRELLGRPENDVEVCELASLRENDPLVVNLLQLQSSDGSWKATESAGLTLGTRLLNTAQALARLGYMEVDPSNPAIKRGAEFIFSLQRDDGSWPSPGDQKWKGTVVTPLQTALPLRGLAFCGYATDPRAEKAYAWLLKHRLPDGAWPTRVTVEGSYGYRAGYRALPHSRFGCRSNTTGALQCLSLHPEYRHCEQARRALDLLLARETRDQTILGIETARMVGAEPARGFITFFAGFDLGLVLDLCWRVGATLEDQRVSNLVAFIRGLQDEYGLWEYKNPQASRWVTFDLLRSLSRLDREGEWVSLEPQTPFEGYPRVQRRY